MVGVPGVSGLDVSAVEDSEGDSATAVSELVSSAARPSSIAGSALTVSPAVMAIGVAGCGVAAWAASSFWRSACSAERNYSSIWNLKSLEALRNS
jgi:hypothetical protein